MVAVVGLWLPAGAGLGASEECALSLVDVAQRAGIDFVHDRGSTGSKYNPETMGSGLAWLDWDGDGWLDLYVMQSGAFPPDGGERARNRLYRNLGNGRFADVTERARAGERSYGQGVLAFDAEGDGDVDLYLGNYGADVYLRNNGDGTFVDATAAAGIDVDLWTSAAAAGDGDGDGDLDLYVARYLRHTPEDEPFCVNPETHERWYCGPSVFTGEHDVYLRNRGDGTFEDATVEAGLSAADGKGMGVLFADLDADGHPDLYVANDMTMNHLFLNQGDGTFLDLSLGSGAAVSREGLPEAGMGVVAGDVDGDLDPDLLVTNYEVQTNTLYRNLGQMQFEDESATSGFGVPSFNMVGFGLVLADFDLDGHLDAFVGNGHTVENPARANVTYAQPDLLLLGDGSGGFQLAECAFANKEPTVSRGAAVADWDNDGDPDLAVQRSGGPLALLADEVATGPWLGVDLIGRPPNTQGVGSVVTVSATTGRQARWVLAGDSYQSSSDRRALFGFSRGSQIETVEILWPTGDRQRFVRPAAGAFLRAVQPP